VRLNVDSMWQDEHTATWHVRRCPKDNAQIKNIITSTPSNLIQIIYKSTGREGKALFY
jgi:hypothetical protein